MTLLNSESKKEVFDLIDKFNSSSLFELELSIPVPPPILQPQYIKIKMMKLAQDKPEEWTECNNLNVTIEDSEGRKENLEIKK